MTALLEKPQRPEGKYRLSFAEFERLCEIEFFGDTRVELLNGEVFVKGKQNPPHQQAVTPRAFKKSIEWWQSPTA